MELIGADEHIMNRLKSGTCRLRRFRRYSACISWNKVWSAKYRTADFESQWMGAWAGKGRNALAAITLKHLSRSWNWLSSCAKCFSSFQYTVFQYSGAFFFSPQDNVGSFFGNVHCRICKNAICD